MFVVNTSMIVSVLFAALIFDVCLLLLYLEVKHLRKTTETIADLIAYDYAEEGEEKRER